MDQAILVGPDLNAGCEALATLDGAGVKPNVAMMAVFPEYGDFRLVLSSRDLDQTDILKSYHKVAEILRGRFVYTLPPIMICPAKDPFVRDVRKKYGKMKDIAGQRISGQFGERFVEAGYLYRVQ